MGDIFFAIGSKKKIIIITFFFFTGFTLNNFLVKYYVKLGLKD